jgi:hypothetical protein
MVERSRHLYTRLQEADVIDWGFGAAFFALGMLVATLIVLVW